MLQRFIERLEAIAEAEANAEADAENRSNRIKIYWLKGEKQNVR